MGTDINKTLIIWIDKNVNATKDNKLYQEKIRKFDNIIFECYESITEAFKYFKTVESFRKTIIITSGRLYEEFLKEFKACQSELKFIPKIVIFTGDSRVFISRTKDSLPLNHLFYNIGGVKDDINDLIKFIGASLNKYNGKFEPKKDSYLRNETLNFIKITDEKELILPVYYANYLKTPTEEQIKKFNQNMLAQYINEPPISFLFSQLTEVEDIPPKLLSKFWLRAYSACNCFNTDMNEKLLRGEYNEYLPMIEKLYDGVSNGKIDSDFSELYKGFFIENREEYEKWKIIIEEFNRNRNARPHYILYRPSFCSFYNDKKKLDELKNKFEAEISRYTYFISLILETPSNFRFVKNQTIINKEISYFDSDSEVLFFPFSCFEIKKVKQEKENFYKITLNYLENHTDLFQPNEKITFENVPENDFSKMVFNSDIIDANLIKMPSWFGGNNGNGNNANNNNQNYNNIYSDNNQNTNQQQPIINNNLQNINPGYIPNQFNFVVEKIINDFSLLSSVKNLCLTSICQSSYENYDQLRDIIQNNLMQLFSCNWWVQVGVKKLSYFGSVNSDLVMIFHYINSNLDFYVHVAKLE